MKDKLAPWRKKIDQADQRILRELRARFRAAEKIGKIKLQEGLPLVQGARWKEVIRKRQAQARKIGLGKDFTQELLELIHRESLRIQKALSKGKRSRKSRI